MNALTANLAAQFAKGSELEKTIRENLKGRGAKVIDRLSYDLHEAFPDMKGFSSRNLKYMRAFATAWPDKAIVQELLAQLSWYQNLALLEKIKDGDARIWYARQTRAHGWSHNILKHQIELRLYERQGKLTNNFSLTLPPAESDMATQIFKDPYIRHKNAKNLQPFLKGVIDYYLPVLLTEATGSTFPNVSNQQLSKLEIIVPESIETQARIGAILSVLDDKIELNRQTNQTLEAIAQAIFKEWFVDFRFPHSPLEGWQAKPDGVDSSLRPCPTSKVASLHARPASLSSWQKNSLFPFWSLPKNHTLQERAKELRKQGILSEVVFWKAFKDKKKLGWDIDRQVIIGNFIVDFFIPELGLVFEIDGSSHNDKQAYDQERDAFLSSLQLKVVRISDKDVLRNIEGVWSFVTKSIKDRVEELEAKSPPRPSGTPQEEKKCEMQDSELVPFPEGWRVGKLGEILKLSNETINPGLYPEMEYFHYSIPAFDDGGIPKIEKGNSILSNKFKLKSYSLLVSKLNPRIPRIWPIAIIDKEFIEKNKGKLQIISDDGFYQFDSNGENIKLFNGSFPGSIINLQFRTDDVSTYTLADEVRLDDIF